MCLKDHEIDDLDCYDPSYRLLEEARESWDYFVSDEIVYSLDPLDVAFDSPIGIAKDYLHAQMWIECHITFQLRMKPKRYLHYTAILENCMFRNCSGQMEINNRAMSRDSHVLINVSHLIELPKKVAPLGFGIPSFVRLKRSDDCQCLVRHADRLFGEQTVVSLPKHRELGIFGIGHRELGEAPYQLVERGPQVVKKLANDKRNSVWNIRKFNLEETPLVFKITLGTKPDLRFTEGINLLPQSLKVHFRPSCLQIGVSQSDTHNG